MSRRSKDGEAVPGLTVSSETLLTTTGLIHKIGTQKIGATDV